MTKKIIFASLVLGIGLVSCQKETPVNTDRFVDVTMTTTSGDMASTSADKTKTEVTTNGGTNWSVGDMVSIVDVDNSVQPFTSKLLTSSYTSKFSGILLGERGEQTYYAFYSAPEQPCSLDKHILIVSRKDLVVECCDLIASKYGSYCSMVAIPASFNASDPKASIKFNFEHINCLIEANVIPLESKAVAESKLANVQFDKVVFTLTATTGVNEVYNTAFPFNTKVSIDMETIKGGNAIDIPYTSMPGKVNKISSTLKYTEPTTVSQQLTRGTTYFGIPLFALPTEDKFTYQSDIVFYLGGVEVYHLRKTGKADGLNLSGLNNPSFNDSNIYTGK